MKEDRLIVGIAFVIEFCSRDPSIIYTCIKLARFDEPQDFVDSYNHVCILLYIFRELQEFFFYVQCIHLYAYDYTDGVYDLSILVQKNSREHKVSNGF